MAHDTLVLNQETKRLFTTGLVCYNCGEEYFVEQGQGFDGPPHPMLNGKEFCDMACSMAFAKVQMDVFEWSDYYETISAHLGYEPYVPPSFEALRRFGGPLSVEEYKVGQRPQLYEGVKRVRLTPVEEANEF